MPQFDVAGARKAGYSDDEIISHLTQTRKFDVAGAKKSGYSSDEIIQHLSAAPSQFTPEGAPGIPKPNVQMEGAPGFGERLYESTVGALAGAEEAYRKAPGQNPYIKAANAFVVNPIKGAIEQAVANPNSPAIAKPLEAIGNLLVPDPLAKDLASGNLAGAAGTVAGAGLTAVVPSTVKRGAAAARSAARNVPASLERAVPVNPTTRIASEAQGWAESRGIPTTVGERTGNRALQTAERMAENVPGASSTATEFYSSRNQQIKAEGQRLARGVGEARKTPDGLEVDPTAAAEEVSARLQGRASDLRDWYKKKYSSVEEAINRNTQRKQERLDAEYKDARFDGYVERGTIIQDWIRENRKRMREGNLRPQLPEPDLPPRPQAPAPAIPAQVDMTPIRQGLKQFYDELSRTMTTTQRESSPGYQRIKAIVEDETPARSALDLDQDLSEVKRLLRKESGGYAATPSGRYAAKFIDEVQGRVDNAIAAAGGPQALARLQKARAGVKEMHRTLDALDNVLPKDNSGPVQLFDRLTARRDSHINDLKEIQQRAPKAIENLAATWMEGALAKIRGEGASANMNAATTAFRNLGPRTKRILFGENAAEIQSFFENAPAYLKDINPSGSAKGLLATQVFGLGGTLVGSIVGGGLTALPQGVAVAGAAAGSARLVAQFLFRPGNARKLELALRTNPETISGRVRWKRLNAAIEADPELAATLQSIRNEESTSQPNPTP